MSAAFSAIMIAGALVLPLTSTGMIEQSTTLSLAHARRAGFKCADAALQRQPFHVVN